MSDFQGRENVVLKPGDTGDVRQFQILVAGSLTAKGTIPFGTTVSGIAVTAYKDDDTDVSSDLISSYSLADNVVSVIFKYPVMAGDGNYYVKFALTLSTGAVKNLSFAPVRARAIDD